MPETKDRIKYVRLKRGYTQQEIADFIGVTRATVGNYERGNISAPSDAIAKIAEYCDTSTEFLLCMTDYEGSMDWLNKAFCTKADAAVDVFRFMDELSDLNNEQRYAIYELSQIAKQHKVALSDLVEIYKSLNEEKRLLAMGYLRRLSEE